MKNKLFAILLALSTSTLSQSAQRSHQSENTKRKPNYVDNAAKLLESMTERQRSQLLVDAKDPRRYSWHYYPEDIRELNLEGLPIDGMSLSQRKTTMNLISSLISREAMRRVYLVFALEELLRKHDNSGVIRNPYKYHLSYYGIPSKNNEWGIGFEGHHLSLNFVFRGEELISTLPLAFGANPETVFPEYATKKLPAGTRLLKDEERLAIELFSSFDPSQRAQAKLSSVADVDPRDVGSRCLNRPLEAGIRFYQLSEYQQNLVGNLVLAHSMLLTPEFAASFQQTWTLDPGSIRLWWKGEVGEATNYSYGIENQDYSIELAMAQVALDKRPANHVHHVIRSINGDFGRCQ